VARYGDKTQHNIGTITQKIMNQHKVLTFKPIKINAIHQDVKSKFFSLICP
jgi:hypothetical protein